jgi:hypothetical protein
MPPPSYRDVGAEDSFKTEPLDLSHHYSETTKQRLPSKVKDFYKFFQIPGIGNLAGGRSLLRGHRVTRHSSPACADQHQDFRMSNSFRSTLLKHRRRSPNDGHRRRTNPRNPGRICRRSSSPQTSDQILVRQLISECQRRRTRPTQ